MSEYERRFIGAQVVSVRDGGVVQIQLDYGTLLKERKIPEGLVNAFDVHLGKAVFADKLVLDYLTRAE